MTPEQWETVGRLVGWLDRENGRGEHERAMRLIKLTEEVGEVGQAYVGLTGQNPRKGVTHTAADVADELCDVIVTAAVALHSFSPDPAATLAAKLDAIAVRTFGPPSATR
ncbi:MazG-like family protein [Streptomyces sp. NPDC047841]|uniref:MazG-like family protein n=1 Tax=Streptomyces sp. NPDC047841 TaxID=3154708 RepID=UPI003454E310